MIYICADDYGLCDSVSMHIQRCIDEGMLNKVSVFPNLDPIDLSKIANNRKIRISLHLNLVEGKCMAEPEEINMIADENGNFRYRFGGLFKLWLFHGKALEEQAYKEIRAQVLFWKKNLREGMPFCVDSHQHTHMIPAVFKALVKVMKDENVKPEYVRIPAEPLLPYIKTPSLYFTYSPINIIKQWLLKILWMHDKKYSKEYNIPTAHFFGILFSGKMDEKRVKKILPHYVSMAEKDGKDVEVLFHPGYFEGTDYEFQNENIIFEKFYFSENRKTEFDSVMKITERSVR